MTLPALQNPSLGPMKSACSNAATSTGSCSGWYLPGPRYAHQIPLEWGQPFLFQLPASASSTFTVSPHTAQVRFSVLGARRYPDSRSRINPLAGVYADLPHRPILPHPDTHN